MLGEDAVGGAPACRGDLRLTDLHLALGDVVALFAAPDALDATDAFLLAAGAAQVVRDAFESDPVSVRRAAGQLARALPALPARAFSASAERAATALERLRDVAGARRELEALAVGLEAVVGRLADGCFTDALDDGALVTLRELLASPAAGRDDVAAPTITLPSCFRSFDLHPNDLRTLARRLLAGPEAAVPGHLVLGVRTSGTYLAPLLAAALQRDGAVARWTTLRPGRGAPPSVRGLLDELANRGWRLVIVDDPPSTGGSLVAAARASRSLGFPSDATALAFALHEDRSVPASLSGYASVVLDWSEWDVHRRLGPDAVAAVLRDAGRTDVDASHLRRVALPPRPSPNGHARAGYELVGGQDAGAAATLVAEGAGLGYLGRHGLAVAAALGDRVPEPLGFRDGVLVRRWLPEHARVALDAATLEQATDYVIARRAALPVARDASARMPGRQPAWEVASRLLAAPYRELGLALRALVMDAAMRRILSPPAPSVVDGQTGPGSWFEVDGRVQKVAVAERAFSHLDLACYDAAYDVAGLVADVSDPARVAEVLARYERATGDAVSPERLLCYRLVHCWDRQRLGLLTPDAAESRMARAWQDWASDRLLDGPLDEGEGPFCVLDVDGVLESARMGAPALTPSAATALRTLRAHGLRPLLATGRSLDDLKDRCSRYHLLGGTAEYGGVAYARRDGAVQGLLGADQVAVMAELRARLAATPGVVVATGCRTMVRAYRVGRGGGRRPLEAAVVATACDHAPEGVQVIQGLGQTDLVAAGVDKGRGVRAALALLGAPDARVALAVGDGEPDLPMLALADDPRVPANAARLAVGAITATSSGSQRGLLEAVADHVGHGAAPCATCAPEPVLPDGAALVAELLHGVEGGRAEVVRAAPAVFLRAWRLARAPHTEAASVAKDRARAGAVPEGPSARTRAADVARRRRRRAARGRRSARGRRRG